MEPPTPGCSSARHSWSLQEFTTVRLNWTRALHCYMQWMGIASHLEGAGGPTPFSLTAQILLLAKPSTQLTMHTHPSAGVFNPLKFALSHEEEVVKWSPIGIYNYRYLKLWPNLVNNFISSQKYNTCIVTKKILIMNHQKTIKRKLSTALRATKNIYWLRLE